MEESNGELNNSGEFKRKDYKLKKPLKEIEEARLSNHNCRDIEKVKQFDVVVDDSDHHFSNFNQTSKEGKNMSNIGKASKKIMQEWKILQKNLPDSIYVRVYEGRIDLLRAVIVGASGTPYHDGLFFFDFCFLPDYPARPPEVYYRSYGLRINPNLYANGRVCLSLLNTWTGKKNEKWSPSSTILQVLVSLQALVLNEKPYFNEPLTGALPGRNYWDKKSFAYNEDVFVLSCKTMLYVLSNPPKHFENLVAWHFRERAQMILMACKAYMNGWKIGSFVEIETGSCSDSSILSTRISSSKKFKVSMEQLYPKLVKAFMNNGSSLGHFVKQMEDKSKERSFLPPPLVVKEKDGFRKRVFSKFKKILRLNKVGSSKE